MNPISGTKNKDAARNHILQTFGDAAGDEPTVHVTTHAGDGYAQALRFAQQQYDTVVAVGGDGTVNEVARGLLHSRTALGIIPMGSGNGLARHLHVPLRLEKAVDVIRAGCSRRIDAAEINGRVFFCTSGVGFDALIGNLFNSKGKRGMYNYVKLATKAAVQYTSHKYRIEIDGQTLYRKAFLITFANASQWGNNAYIAPHADISDGWLDVVILNRYAVVAAPVLLPRLFARSIHKAWTTEILRGKRIKIIRAKDDYVHFDGESAVMGKVLDVQILPLALNVIIPPE